jgi:hypothetical protein
MSTTTLSTNTYGALFVDTILSTLQISADFNPLGDYLFIHYHCTVDTLWYLQMFLQYIID